jgi:hypothetical protein
VASIQIGKYSVLILQVSIGTLRLRLLQYSREWLAQGLGVQTSLPLHLPTVLLNKKGALQKPVTLLQQNISIFIAKGVLW